MKTKNKFYLGATLMALTSGLLAQGDDGLKLVTSDSDVSGVSKLRSQINEDLKAIEDTPPILKSALRSEKLDPEITDASWPYYKKAVEAENLFHTPEKLISKSIPILNEPGQDSQIIEVALHYGVTVSFKNTRGESLFIERYKPGNEMVINVDDGNGPESESVVSNFLTLTNKSKVGSTNLHVWLVDSRSSLSFYVKIVDKPQIYADRIDFVVVEPGEDAVGEKLALKGFDELTMVLNNRKPSPDASRVYFSDDSVTGWELDGMMWLRTTERLLFPTHNPSMALSSDTQQGMNVYYVNKHPIIHVTSDSGEIRKLSMRGDQGE